MRGRKALRSGMLFWACLAMLVPTPLLQAATPAASGFENVAPVARDVALGAGGVLLGRVTDRQARPLAQVPVALLSAGEQQARTITDATGHFRFVGLFGGSYEISAGTTHGLFRLWTPGTAPPAHHTSALLVVGEEIVRGQDGPIGYWMGKPLVMTALAGAAVAVPIGIHNHRQSTVASP